MFYFPLIFLFMMALFVLLVVLFTLIMIGAISFAFDKIGIHPEIVFVLLLACLVGSYLNIPIDRFQNE